MMLNDRKYRNPDNFGILNFTFKAFACLSSCPLVLWPTDNGHTAQLTTIGEFQTYLHNNTISKGTTPDKEE